jgi:hypothetical protein
MITSIALGFESALYIASPQSLTCDRFIIEFMNHFNLLLSLLHIMYLNSGPTPRTRQE